jgi:formylglycine-generating enzyme required for sulfatase activity
MSLRPLKVFLCHAHADRDAVRALYARLTADGVDAWFDKEKLIPGQDWKLEIRKAVREADVVIVCLSKQFNQAGFRQKEVRLALDTANEKPEGEIFIIPARLEECGIPENLNKLHCVDLFEDDGYERLVRALRIRADKIGATLQIKGNWLPAVSRPLEKMQDEDSKLLALIKKFVPYKLIHYIEGQVFENYRYKDIHLLYSFLDKAGNPDFVFLDGALEKRKKEFVRSAQVFCDTLMELTQTLNKKTGSKSIIYDPFNEPEKYEDAKLRIHQLADDVVRSYRNLFEYPKKLQRVNHDVPKHKTFKAEYIVALITAIATIIAGIFSSPWIEKWFTPITVPTPTLTFITTATAPFTQTPSATFTSASPSETPEPSITPAPTETFTPTVTPFVVTVDDSDPRPLNCRRYPDTNSISVAKLISGAKLLTVGRTANNEWLFVQVENNFCWLNSTYVVHGDLSALPIGLKNDSKNSEMILIPSGSFSMGGDRDDLFAECQKVDREHCQDIFFGDVEPPHDIYLNAFYIDKYEVSNSAYKLCVTAGKCEKPDDEIFYNDPKNSEYPVVYVTWEQSKEYCEWRGGRLPSESEWEKAARGVDGRLYPWGNTFDGSLANFKDKNYSNNGDDPGLQKYDDGFSKFAPIKSYSDGVSPYGIYNMSGNVWEWVNDKYSTNDKEFLWVMKGGSWAYLPYSLLTANRGNTFYLNSYNNLGFRCVSDLIP